MLRSMRQNTKIIMLIVAVAFVGLMVFEWGMDISGRGNPQASGEVGRVNDTAISYQLWSRTYRNLSDQLRQQKGSALNDRELDLIEEQAWNELVTEILIAEEIRGERITVTDEEVKLAFQTSPPPWLRDNELFQTGGQFDFEKYRAFFSGPAADPALLQQIELYYREVLPRLRLFERVSSGIYVSDSELWSFYRQRSETVRVRYVALDPETAIDDSEVAISEEELRSYYQENLQDFQRPATAEVSLVEISRLPEPADSAAALERARTVRTDILAGAEFEKQAQTLSADRGSASRGGDLGWFGKGEMTPEFEQVAFELRPGEISEPVLTQFGYHIIKVAERQEDRVRAAHILIPVELHGESEDKLLGSVDRLERIALRSGLADAVDSVGVTSRRVTLAAGTEFVPGIGSFGPAHDWAFHDSTSVGDLSPVYETDEGFYVFELADRLPEGFLPFIEAEPSLRRRVTLEKKIETARWLADEMAAELKSGKSLEDVASDRGLELRESPPFSRLDFVPGIGQGSPVIGTAFGLEVDELAGPILADNRLFFIQVSERLEADQETFLAQRENFRAQLTLQRREAAVDEWLRDLREQADIKDWRRQIFVPRS